MMFYFFKENFQILPEFSSNKIQTFNFLGFTILSTDGFNIRALFV